MVGPYSKVSCRLVKTDVYDAVYDAVVNETSRELESRVVNATVYDAAVDNAPRELVDRRLVKAPVNDAVVDEAPRKLIDRLVDAPVYCAAVDGSLVHYKPILPDGLEVVLLILGPVARHPGFLHPNK